ncbi:MAG: nucleotide sugar dehydrogenase [Methanosarcinaceae archaeon]|nr:nucleotide sugar dehydrogenase [Methanosarcinaceae archaeon]MDD4748487.1 nucleotide sugar dehydrogenase [Methanosarcinaceae archaeon]
MVGLGYVGLPLSIAFSKKFWVLGYDTNKKCINDLLKGKSHIDDVSELSLQACLNKSFFPTFDSEQLKKCDFLIICVPTPLNEACEPNLDYVKAACHTISQNLQKGQFVILESTTYPGTTEEVVLPILEESKLKAGIDFGLAYSPERIDPGNKRYTVENTPKVVGGINEECTKIAAFLYGSLIQTVVQVQNTKIAEAVKMVENIFRNVNIALVNELSIIFEKMEIDSWEVIRAAASKPYGYMPFYPGPGVGGHCIPLDPYYMSYKAKKYGIIPRFIETSGEINNFMKVHAVNLVECGLNKVNKNMYGSTVAVLGLAYKKNIEDTREAPAINIIEEIVNLGAKVKVYDPFVQLIKTKVGVFHSEENIYNALRGADCSIFLTDHDFFKEFSLEELSKLMNSPVIVDCKNIVEANSRSNLKELVYLGIGKVNKY